MDFFDLIPNAGAAAAWVDSVEAFGSGKMSMAEILKPSISLAEEGYKYYRFCHPHLLKLVLLTMLGCQ